MPIASPETYRAMLDDAKAEGYAFPAVNVTSSETLNVALKAKHGSEGRHYPVFHGGSGSTLDEIHETLGYGVVKMNIDTDCQYAHTRPIADHMFTNYPGVVKVDGDVGDKKTYDPRSYMKKAERAMSARVIAACNELKSTGHHISS